MAETEAQRLSELRSLVARDPAAPGFATLAELHRRARRFAEAERVLRAGLGRRPDDLPARALLSLVLWDQGRDADARSELSRVAAALVPAAAESAAAEGAVSEAELDHAFAEAETDAEQLIDPNKVAAEAILHADAGAAEGLREDSAEPGYAPGQAFVTETMASLLDRQGDARGAARIRAALTAEEDAPAERRASSHKRARSLAVLERWLVNLRRDWA